MKRIDLVNTITTIVPQHLSQHEVLLAHSQYNRLLGTGRLEMLDERDLSVIWTAIAHEIADALKLPCDTPDELPAVRNLKAEIRSARIVLEHERILSTREELCRDIERGENLIRQAGGTL